MQCYEKCGIWTGPVGSGTGGTTGGSTGGEVDGSTTGQIPSCDECIEVPETETKCFKENPGGNWSKIGGCHSTESGCNGPQQAVVLRQAVVRQVQEVLTHTHDYWT